MPCDPFQWLLTVVTDQGAVTQHLIGAGYLHQTPSRMRLPALPSTSRLGGAGSDACVLAYHLKVACYYCGYLSPTALPAHGCAPALGLIAPVLLLAALVGPHSLLQVV